ncbi:MAG: nucleotidyltransferase domain-containing protein [Flavobacteriales bacterium]|nr:nucleotidyltransferase domain-containing protein [Flavobacteriales bacterium]
MTIEELKNSGHIIFECISGSRAYGLQTPTSDTDIRGVFVLPENQFYSLDYVSQVNNETNDIVYYELRKFVELCLNNNPNILELLNVPEDCVLYKHDLFDRFQASDFLSKRCEKSFANYAYAQIKKARGLEKKIVNPVDEIRKTPLDFCLVYHEGKSIPLSKYLEIKVIQQEDCGLARIPNMKDCYNIYHSNEIPYKGIMKSDQAYDIALSSIPKGEEPLVMMYFNLDGYSTYCKKYREYWDWVEKRNEDRYETTINYGKNYDSKNMMHTFRLLNMAKEIAESKEINVFRKDRELLLAIKAGEFEYDKLLEKAEALNSVLEDLYKQSDLPELPDKIYINQMMIQVRKEFYKEKQLNNN